MSQNTPKSLRNLPKGAIGCIAREAMIYLCLSNHLKLIEIMALKFLVKKTTFGFDKTNTEKYVARPMTMGTVSFASFCNQVTKVGMAPRGVVKMVIDGAIDALEMNLVNGLSVKLGDFGTFRSSFGCKSQDEADNVSADTLRHRKIIFTPGEQLKNMLQSVSIQKFVLPETGKAVTPPEEERPGEL